MKCFLLAFSCTDAAAMRYQGISQATSNWVAGLMSGIESAGGHATAFSHVHDALWPKGKMFPGNIGDMNPSVDTVFVRYGNFPGLRSSWIRAAIVRSVHRHIKRHGLPDVLFTYNLYPHYAEAAKIISQEYSIPWIPIILDQDDPEVDNWQEFLRDSAASRGSVFLSWWGYVNAPCDNKIHLDGGVASDISLPSAAKNVTKNIVYTGKFTGYGGAKLLEDVISNVGDKNVNFILCGKGDASSLQKKAKIDTRIIYKGFVADAELESICRQADVFLNPRPSDVSDNRMIFPSKILHYLSYGVPVISTWTEGLSDDYRAVLVVPEEEGAEAFAHSVQEVLRWPDSVLQDYRQRVNNFLDQKSWKVQGERLIEFVNETIAAGKATN